jgi:formaldehyde-activating enzyme
MKTEDIDGKLAQGWGGESPNGIHVNVLLARRGSPTAAAITTAFTSPSPGFTPVLASLGLDQASYVTLNPPTVILNKSKPDTVFQEAVIFGAAPVGIAQGVLDAVAEGLLAPDQETIVLVSLWVDPAAADETAARRNARTATFKAVQEAVKGRSEQDRQDLVAQRDDITHPFYRGH